MFSTSPVYLATVVHGHEADGEVVNGRTQLMHVKFDKGDHEDSDVVRVRRYVKYPMTRGKMWALVLYFILVVFLWTTVLGKLAVDGAETYSTFFTNWMWTYGTIFYTVYCLSYLDWSGAVYDFVVTYACWPFISNVAQVFILVAVLKVSGTKIYEEAAEEVGWGLTLFWDQLVHMFPLVWALIWLMFSWTDVRTALNAFEWRKGRRRYFVLFILYNFGMSNLFVFTYWAVNDFYEVYGIDVNVWVVILLVEIVYLLFNTMPLILLSPVSHATIDTAYGVDVRTKPASRATLVVTT